LEAIANFWSFPGPSRPHGTVQKLILLYQPLYLISE
jgi:hypothetical protein